MSRRTALFQDCRAQIEAESVPFYVSYKYDYVAMKGEHGTQNIYDY